MRICLIANQIAAWGKIGGFGTATRSLGAGLVKAGHEVHAVVPRRARYGQGALEQLDGMTVHGVSAFETLTSGKVFKAIDADVHHSQEPTIASWFAQRTRPDAVHVVTCRDPRDLRAHLVELKHTNCKRRVMFPATWWYEASPPVRRAVRHADAVFCPAPVIIERAKALYGDDVAMTFIPSPVDLPPRPPVKADRPLALFVGRWDHRKRIELFFELARRCPDVRFVAVGRAHDDAYDQHLRAKYGTLPNVELPGFLPRFGDDGLYRLYEQAWVLVNTSAREGLPYTFIEAAAWGCAILSGLDPEGFASRFGYHVAGDDFKHGMDWLLADNHWRTRGEAGAVHVARHWSEQASIRDHLAHYQSLLDTKRPSAGREAL